MRPLTAVAIAALGFAFVDWSYGQTPDQSEMQYLDQLEQDKAEYQRNLFSELGRFQKFDNMPMLDALMKVKDRIVWLSERFSKSDADYRFGYAFAVYQWKIGNANDAVVTLAKADLRAFVDSQRCDDKSSSQGRIGPWRNAAQPIYSAIRTLPQEQKVKIREAVEQEESKMALRPPSSWMCSGGAKHIAKVLQKYPEIGALEPGKPIPQAILDKYPKVIAVKGNSVELTDYSIQPDFIPEDVWNKDLPVMVQAFKKSYFSALGFN